MSRPRLFATRSTGGEKALDQAAKIHGLYAVSTTSAGSVKLRDGGASGTVLGEFDTPAAAEGVPIPFPGYIEFDTDVYVDLTNVTAVTLFHE